MDFRRLSGNLLAGFLSCGAVLVAGGAGCGSSSTPPPPHSDAGKGDSPQSSGCSVTPADDDYAGCGSCTFSPTASPATCTSLRSVNACCDWVAAPTGPLARAIGL